MASSGSSSPRPPPGSSPSRPPGITGPRVAVAGTTADLTAWAAQRGGSVTQRLWTFGDGSAVNAGGPDASHVFAQAGCYTVTMSATLSLGTASTRTWNVDVIAASSAVPHRVGPAGGHVLERAGVAGRVAPRHRHGHP